MAAAPPLPDSKYCLGTHSAGADGCNNADCKGRQLCIAGCVRCPDFVARFNGVTNTACTGGHSVTGGCDNEACRGLELCQPDCMTCPEFEVNARDQRRTTGSGNDGVDGSLVGSNAFWARSGEQIKIYMACLAGPADPATRNDIELMKGLQARFEIPQENVWLMLEHQVSKASVEATIVDLAASCGVQDAAFVYIGGHGAAETDTTGYLLGSHRGSAAGAPIAAALWSCKCPVFAVIDSCHSGALINDATEYARKHPEKAICPELVILSSTQASNVAMTGWRILASLNSAWVKTSSRLEPSADDGAPLVVARSIANTLRTGNDRQRAQYVFFRDGRAVESRSDDPHH